MIKSEIFIVSGFLLFCICTLIYQLILAPRNRAKKLRKNLRLNGFVSKPVIPQLEAKLSPLLAKIESDSSDEYTQQYGFSKVEHTYKSLSSVSISESYISPSGFWCYLGILTTKTRSTSRGGFFLNNRKHKEYWSDTVWFVGNNSNKNSGTKVIFNSRHEMINELLSSSSNEALTQKLHHLNNSRGGSNHEIYTADETNDALIVWLSNNKVQLNNFRANILLQDGNWVFSVNAKFIKSNSTILFSLVNEIRSILK